MTAVQRDDTPDEPVRPVRAGNGPTVLRIVLGAQLRRLRQASNISAQEAGAAIRGSHAKISRLELGRVGFRRRDVADLLTLYGVENEQKRHEFFSLAEQANVPGWWHQYTDILPGWFEYYLGLEQASSVVRTYEPHLVPGLLQTEDCARAVIRSGHPGAPAEDVERRVVLRMRRQQVLTQPDAPTVWVVVDEAALRRLGTAATARAQIRHLIEIAELPNVTLQTMPFHAGTHPAAGVPFSILRFCDPDLPDVVYLEQLTSALYLDKRRDIEHYLKVMDQLCVQALHPAATLNFLARMSKYT
ncbi:MAG TPA: helix-turn-helix transcriptional regulator [Pseudonocardiaceae bacterium]